MSYTAYPTGTQVTNLLTAAGATIGTVDVTGLAAAASAEWERLTGWKPFLSAGDTQTRTFPMPVGHILELEGGLLTCSAITVGGSDYTVNADLWLRPSNAAAIGVPYTSVDFWPKWSGQRWTRQDLISVTGTWGYCTEIPADAFQAILARAGALALENLSNDGQKKVTLGNISVEYGADAPVWRAQWLEAVRRYARGILA